LPRPDRLVVIAGTGTEVGKTWAGARLAADLVGAGVRVAARKPVQSFEPASGPTDADLLAAATGEQALDVCRADRWYELAMAPPMAGDALGRAVPSIAEMVDSLEWPAGCDLGLVESVGGVRSPLARDGDTATLVDALSPDAVVLVADAGLGTVNAVRLALGALSAWETVVFLNHFDPNDDLHRRNAEWLADRDGADVVTDLGVISQRYTGWCRPASPVSPSEV
jgi:dethiobiotin synthetase